MKRIITIFVIIVALTLAIVFLSFTSAKQYNEETVGMKVSISWKTVNLRNNYSTGNNIIDQLNEGELVTLTGYSYDYVGGDGQPTESWVEVITKNDQTGWVVTESINW